MRRFCFPARGKRHMEGRWVKAGSLRLFTRRTHPVEGRPPLVLVHGLVVSSRYMVPLARELGGDFAVYALDLPGFGRSSKPSSILSVSQLAEVLVAWMEEIDLARAAFLGNSFGCQVIATVAQRFPERVSHVILQGPTVDPCARTVQQQGARWLLDCLREARSFLPIVALDFLSAGLRRSWGTLQVLLQDRIEEKLSEVRVPALLVRGSKDPIVSQHWAETAAQLLPQGRLCVVEGAPHVMNYSTPGVLARLVRRFLPEDAQ